MEQVNQGGTPGRYRRPVAAALVLAAGFLLLWAAAYVLLPALERGVRALARRVAEVLRSRRRLASWVGRADAFKGYLPLALVLAAGAAVAFAAAHAFTDLARALKEGSPVVRSIDVAVSDWFRAHRTDGETLIFRGLTGAGSAPAAALAVVAASVLLARSGRFRWAAYLALTAAGGAVLNQLLKLHYARQRPDLGTALAGADGYSFPSGHAMEAAVVCGALGYLAARSSRTWRTKSAAFAALATLALGIGVSRLYLGVHWASDVAAGFAAGALWLAAATTGYEVVRQVRIGRTGVTSSPAPGPPSP